MVTKDSTIEHLRKQLEEKEVYIKALQATISDRIYIIGKRNEEIDFLHNRLYEEYQS